MKKPKAPQFVIVGVFTTITIIFWIFYSLYHVLTSKPPLQVPPEILAPINPSLDIDSLNDLQGRIFFEEGETTSFTVSPSLPSPTPTVEVEEEVEEETEEIESPAVATAPGTIAPEE